ncbi:splicing factor 3B subunit 6-like protein [Kockiozyma suomiensis]|uniref:splicing factor 3B subunit 6-like protein n=1 Tax=Kockiozyma suomiensis TaxID=1337062 RepID=UPI003343A6B8
MSFNSRKISAEINRILFVKNLSYNVTSEELYDLFGRFGSIRQIRLGNAQGTKGTAFVVYDELQDAKTACDKLSGFNFQSRYLVVLYHQPDKNMLASAAAAQIPGSNGENADAVGATPKRRMEFS